MQEDQNLKANKIAKTIDVFIQKEKEKGTKERTIRRAIKKKWKINIG